MSEMLRRGFLQTLAAAPLAAGPARSCLLIRLDGGPSHVDTFDPKPAVSPFGAIRTSAAGVRLCEHLPRTARLAHRFAILRSLTATETNHERAALALPVPPAAAVSAAFDPRYGRTAMGREFSRAVRRLEAGARFVQAGCGRLRWDTHQDNFGRLRGELLPEFDLAFSSLLEDLDASGLLATTLVVAAGEFGRTPRLNAAGGRDHFAGAWSAVLAGAGVPAGEVIGATDTTGTHVTQRPVSPAALASFIERTLRGQAAKLA